MRLGDVAGVLGGFAFPSNLFNKQVSGFPVIKISNLTDGEVDVKNTEYVDIEKVGRDISRFKIDVGDFLVAMTGATAGKVGKLNTKGIFYLNQRVGKFFSKDENALDETYLYYSVINPRNKNTLKRLADGSAQGNMSSSQIENNLELTLPPTMGEQKHIAGVLAAFDDKIENNNRIIKTLEEMAQAIFKEWFIDNVKFKNKNVKSWEVKRLGDIMQFEYGRALKAEERKTGNVPVVGSSGIVGMHNQKLATGPGIVVGRKGTVGSVIWVDTDFYPIDTTFYIVSKLSLYFCFFVLRRQKFIIGDSAVPGLNRNSALSNEIVIPPRELIDKFEEQIKPLFQKTHNIKAENQKLAAMRDLLLPRLMNEEIRV